MDFSRLLSSLRIPRVKTVDIYSHEHKGILEAPVKLTDENASTLARSVSELYFPIDFIADRASKLRYFIEDKNGNEVTNTEITRFITKPNPLQTFSDYVYQYLFNLYADGCVTTYKQVPSTYTSKPNITNISRSDILDVDNLEIAEYTNISQLDISNLTDLIRAVKYTDINGKSAIINKDLLTITNIDASRRCGSSLFSQSPLFKANKAVNNLLAVYSARYNVYVNNGAAGYLVKKNVAENGVMAAVNPQDRDSMIKDINDRNGLTGKKNLYGISSIPMEFINTLVTIKDLMPHEETLLNAIQIAGVYQIPANLIPRTEQAKYENQSESELSVWENTIMSAVNNMCEVLTKDFTLDAKGFKIKADYSGVSAMGANKVKKEDNYSKRLDNLAKIAAISPEKTSEVQKEIDKILNDYATN